MDPSPQSEAVFRLYDYDKAGQIDAREFLIALSNYTGAGKEDKLKFAFSVFDEDGNGVITKAELIKMLKANHMASQDAEVARKADTIMAQADRDGDGVLTFDEFVIVSKKFPNILVRNIFNSQGFGPHFILVSRVSIRVNYGISTLRCKEPTSTDLSQKSSAKSSFALELSSLEITVSLK